MLHLREKRTSGSQVGRKVNEVESVIKRRQRQKERR